MLPITARTQWAAVFAFALVAVPGLSQPLGTAFTYQGRLTDAGAPANGSYDLQFRLYNAASAGSPVGPLAALTSVSVSNGLFTVTLDFGASAFAGSKRWLEVGARPGGSSGAFTTLSPRQELTATPNAAFSATTGDPSVQRRTAAPTCPTGQYLRSLASDGTPTCAPDVDTNSGGTVTSVATGAGLTGGPINLSGTVSVSTGGITTDLLAESAVTAGKIASGAVGLGQINQTEVQVKISGTCPSGQYLRGVNPDGTVSCEAFPTAPTVITIVDDAGDVGRGSSMAIGNDGLPVVSYYDATAAMLKVVHCGNAACSTANATSTVPGTFAAGQTTSIAIGSDSLPVISYQDFIPRALKVARCGNAACSTGNALATVEDSADMVGGYTSIAIGRDNLPVVAYWDETAYSLKFAHCGNVGCSSGNTLTTVDDPAEFVGYFPSLAIGNDGLPVISYADNGGLALKVAHCGNADCTAGNTLTAVDDPYFGWVGWYTSIAVPSDGLPVISYFDLNAGALKVAKCGNPACSAGNTITTVDDPADTVGDHTSIAIGRDGLPVIAYHDQTAGALKVAHCGDASCSSGNTLAVVDDPLDQVGQFTSIAIGNDGFPVISYYDATAGALKVAKCNTRTCQ